MSVGQAGLVDSWHWWDTFVWYTNVV